jgi:hypothetical protein
MLENEVRTLVHHNKEIRLVISTKPSASSFVSLLSLFVLEILPPVEMVDMHG